VKVIGSARRWICDIERLHDPCDDHGVEHDFEGIESQRSRRSQSVALAGGDVERRKVDTGV